MSAISSIRAFIFGSFDNAAGSVASFSAFSSSFWVSAGPNLMM
ncbi:MAG: hypothetical protein ACLQVG_29175 [Terriglobia bacterium]